MRGLACWIGFASNHYLSTGKSRYRVCLGSNLPDATSFLLQQLTNDTHIVPQERFFRGEGVKVDQREEFVQALRLADSSPECFLIEAVIAEDDISSALRQMSSEIRSILQSNPAP